MKIHRIILTGFMGTGKTAIGQLLAHRLGYDFLDTDILVERESGKSISDLFEQEGEPVFRAHEKKMLQKALQKNKVVIATGGGAVVDPDNLKLMKAKGIVIGLSASPEVILERISKMGEATRPLLKGKDALKKIKELLSHRSPYYAQADRIVNTTSQSLEETIEEILNTLKKF